MMGAPCRLSVSAVLALASLATACGDDGDFPPADSGVGDAHAGDAGADSGAVDGATAPPCTEFEAAVSLGNAANGDLDEISGVAASRSNPDVLWVHNDSGDSARIFAMRTDGRHLGEYALTGASHTDWEDMTLGPGPEAGVDYLYVGDTGDNAARDGRGGRASIVVYRVAEPAVDRDQAPAIDSLGSVEALSFVYPDAPHDCEALMVDGDSADLYFLTKENTGMSALYVARAPLTAGATATLERVGEFMFGAPGIPGGPLATGGDFAPDGTSLLVRTYSSVLMFQRTPGSTWASSLDSPPSTLPGAPEMQGEGIAWAPDGRGYYTVSEFVAPAINFYAAAASCAR